MPFKVNFRIDGKKTKTVAMNRTYQKQEDAIARLDAAESDWKATLLSSDELARFNAGNADYIPFNRAVSMHRALWKLFVKTDLGQSLEWTIEENGK